jgi:hypothetical protein
MIAALIDSEAASAGWSTIVDRDLGSAPSWNRYDTMNGALPTQGEGPQSYRKQGEEPTEPLVCACPVDPSGCAPLFTEWAYVLTPEALVIFSHGETDDRWCHRVMATVPWDGPEPDWKTLGAHCGCA